MITEGNLIAVSTLAALYVSCYICLLIDQNSCESKDLDLTLSSAINSTPPLLINFLKDISFLRILKRIFLKF